MKILEIDFDELFRRHVCRHSEFGINVLHLIAVVGIYFSLIGIFLQLPYGGWVVGSLLTAYALVLLKNVPIDVWCVNTLTVLAILKLVLWLPSIPVWAHVVLILLWHRFQNWNHTVYTESFDMSGFKEKYPKGLKLFFLLAIYELPILLHYLVFGHRRQEHAAV